MSKGDEALQPETFLSQGSRLLPVPRVRIGMWLRRPYQFYFTPSALLFAAFMLLLDIRFFCRSEGIKGYRS